MHKKFTPTHFFLKIIFNTVFLVFVAYLLISNTSDIKASLQEMPVLLVLFFIPGILVLVRQFFIKKNK